MKYIFHSILISLLFIGCTKEEAIPVVVDFELDIFKQDYSIPVQVVVINKTEGADTYEWTFEGAVPNRSPLRNPSFITYDAKGIYTVILTASNQDGSEETKEVSITIDNPVVVDFNVISNIDTFSPASFTIENRSTGTTSYSWTFEGGTPASSDQRDPGTVTFTTPGEHTIILEGSNGRETYDIKKTVTVAPYLAVDFAYEVNFEDDDFEVPVQMEFSNNSISATSYVWEFEGASPSTSTIDEPIIVFNETGTHTIILTATNGKETKSIEKEITVTKNNNLRVLKDIKFGINTAHTNDNIGSFYNISERKMYTATDLIENPNAAIDLVYFGLNSSFFRNSFVSPNALQGTTFTALPNPKQTQLINTQELCDCFALLSVEQFDAMENDLLLKGLQIEETPGGIQAFDDMLVSRIVLFQTQDGIKGAIKIKTYQENGDNSYILVDIKVQKEAI